MATPFSFGASANPMLGAAKSSGSIADPGAQPDMMQMLMQLLQGGGGQQQQAGPDLGALLQQIQGARDPVGQHNNRSNLPSYAAGSTSPFNGFFKPMEQAFGRAPAPAAAPADMASLVKPKKKPASGFSFGASAY